MRMVEQVAPLNSPVLLMGETGTIFLNEIGELPLPAPVRLLRVLQQHEIERVGGSHPIPVDVRIISATHQNLEEMVRTGQFREDLWFRLNVFPIIIPPLRQRTVDIPSLVIFLNARAEIKNFASCHPWRRGHSNACKSMTGRAMCANWRTLWSGP